MRALIVSRLRNREGTALVISLVILIMLTLMGVYAVFTSTVETRISGNERLMDCAFYAADGGVDYGLRMIELVLNGDSLPGGANPHSDTSPEPDTTFQDEVMGFGTWSDGTPWLGPTIGDCTMHIGIDRIKSELSSGGEIEFGQTSETKVIVYYEIDSTSSGTNNSSSHVISTYRRVIE